MNFTVFTWRCKQWDNSSLPDSDSERLWVAPGPRKPKAIYCYPWAHWKRWFPQGRIYSSAVLANMVHMLDRSLAAVTCHSSVEFGEVWAIHSMWAFHLYKKYQRTFYIQFFFMTGLTWPRCLCRVCVTTELIQVGLLFCLFNKLEVLWFLRFHMFIYSSFTMNSSTCRAWYICGLTIKILSV